MKRQHLCATLALCALTATACAPADDAHTEDGAPAEALVSRAFDLSDRTGKSTVTVIVSAEDEAALDEIDLDTLELRVGSGGIETLTAGAIEAIDEYKPRFWVEIVDEQLEDGVDRVDLVETAPPAWRAPFVWRYSYSNLDCVDVRRSSFWHAVYVSIWSKDTSASSWSSMVSNRKLSNGETLHRCDTGSYQLKVGVEARELDDYSVEFDD